MRRAKLKAHEVSRIIITATMTPRDEPISVEDLMRKRRQEGCIDLGWHYYVDQNARVHFGVPVQERGSYFERYSRTSDVILIEGDGDYGHEQVLAIKRLIETTQREYADAVPTMHFDLFRGTNPGMTIGELYEQ